MNTKAQTKLIPGTYHLTVDLPALRKDKRRSTDWRCQPMKAGTLFHYTEWTYVPGDDPEVTLTEQRIYPVGGYEHESVRPDETISTRDLEECLSRVDETASLWLRRNSHGGFTVFGVIDELVSSGKISMVDVQEAVTRYLAT